MCCFVGEVYADVVVLVVDNTQLAVTNDRAMSAILFRRLPPERF